MAGKLKIKGVIQFVLFFEYFIIVNFTVEDAMKDLKDHFDKEIDELKEQLIKMRKNHINIV